MASPQPVAHDRNPGQAIAGGLDRAVRQAFQHNSWDHLGGFWKLVRRGTPAKPGGKKRSRYREVQLGDVEPGGGGPGAGVKIASLGLAAGDELKYVYDFAIGSSTG